MIPRTAASSRASASVSAERSTPTTCPGAKRSAKPRVMLPGPQPTSSSVIPAFNSGRRNAAASSAVRRPCWRTVAWAWPCVYVSCVTCEAAGEESGLFGELMLASNHSEAFMPNGFATLEGTVFRDRCQSATPRRPSRRRGSEGGGRAREQDGGAGERTLESELPLRWAQCSWQPVSCPGLQARWLSAGLYCAVILPYARRRGAARPTHLRTCPDSETNGDCRRASPLRPGWQARCNSQAHGE